MIRSHLGSSLGLNGKTLRYFKLYRSKIFIAQKIYADSNSKNCFLFQPLYFENLYKLFIKSNGNGWLGFVQKLRKSLGEISQKIQRSFRTNHPFYKISSELK